MAVIRKFRITEFSANFCSNKKTAPIGWRGLIRRAEKVAVAGGRHGLFELPAITPAAPDLVTVAERASFFLVAVIGVKIRLDFS